MPSPRGRGEPGPAPAAPPTRAKKAKVYRCSCGQFEDESLTALVIHEQENHLNQVTLTASPMYYFVKDDGSIAASAIDLDTALALRATFPECEMVFHLALKRSMARERNRTAADRDGTANG